MGKSSDFFKSVGILCSSTLDLNYNFIYRCYQEEAKDFPLKVSSKIHEYFRKNKNNTNSMKSIKEFDKKLPSRPSLTKSIKRNSQ